MLGVAGNDGVLLARRRQERDEDNDGEDGGGEQPVGLPQPDHTGRSS